MADVVQTGMTKTHKGLVIRRKSSSFDKGPDPPFYSTIVNIYSTWRQILPAIISGAAEWKVQE